MENKILPDLTGVEIDDGDERLKIVMAVGRNRPLLALFSVLLVVWLSVLAVMIVFIIEDVILPGERYRFVFVVMLLVWLLIWYRLGRALWGRWQYFAATREILFVTTERLIIRRPLSILGSTDVYDMQHVSPLYYSQKHRCPGFDYGHQRIYFGQSLGNAAAQGLVSFLNNRYFPQMDEDDD